SKFVRPATVHRWHDKTDRRSVKAKQHPLLALPTWRNGGPRTFDINADELHTRPGTNRLNDVLDTRSSWCVVENHDAVIARGIAGDAGGTTLRRDPPCAKCGAENGR